MQVQQNFQKKSFQIHMRLHRLHDNGRIFVIKIEISFLILFDTVSVLT